MLSAFTNTAPCARTFVVLSLVVIAGWGCGGGGEDGSGGTTEPPPAGGFTIAASTSNISVAQSATSAITVNVSRTGSFTGPVTLAASGLPSGVTGTFSPATVSSGQVSSTLTFTAVASAAAGVSSVTITASATGQSNQTIAIQLTVTSAPAQTGPFTLSISAMSFLALPSNHVATPPLITITRNAGFTGPVAFTVSGLPSTLFIGFSPSSTTGSTTSALILNAGTPNGTYTAQIRGASAQGDRIISLQIVVAPASTGNVKWKWCTASTPRYFVAFKDGTGPWTRVMPSNDSVYSFNLTAASAQLAEVTIDSGGFRTTVHQYTAQEMAARGTAQCRLVRNVSTRSASGSFGGVAGFRTSQVGMGWWFGSANGNGSFTMLNLPAGPLDVIAARNTDFPDPAAIPVDRMIIRRGLNPASGAALPVLDFGAAESFAPTAATWTFLNTNNQVFSVTQTFTTVGGTTGHFALVPSIDGSNAVRAIYGVPQSHTQAGDLHQVVATIATIGPFPGSPVRATRQIVYYGRTLGVPDTLAFGPAMPPATVTSVSPGYLRAQVTVPAEYNAGVSFDVTQTTTGRFFSIHTTRGFNNNSSSFNLQMPDLSGVLGWDTQYNIRSGIATNWWVSGGGPTLDYYDGRYLFNSTRSQWTGAQTGMTAPVDGATYLMARVTGNTNP